MRKWISREEEALFPEFDSFEAAWDFFVKKYDKDMLLDSVDIIDGKKCYFCSLITDWGTYKDMCRLLERGEPLIGLKYIQCRQPIQIFENGHIHIVH